MSYRVMSYSAIGDVTTHRDGLCNRENEVSDSFAQVQVIVGSMNIDLYRGGNPHYLDCITITMDLHGHVTSVQRGHVESFSWENDFPIAYWELRLDVSECKQTYCTVRRTCKTLCVLTPVPGIADPE